MTKRILFVDDEPKILMGLESSLSPMRAQWEMEFASSGEEALKVLAQSPFDAVVTDMRMPGMTGAELLEKIQDEFPQTIRIILSDQPDRESLLRSMAPAHQFLSKPCDRERLKSLLERTVALASLLEDSTLKKFMSRIKCIPSLPSLFQEITSELRSPDPSTSRIGAIIAKDMGMTSKLLQVVNSAAYGLREEISEPGQAVLLLGLDTIQTMVLSLSIFSSFDSRVLTPKEAERLWEHSISVSRLSKLIAKAEGVTANALDPYQSAGLLHDIGKVVMATADPAGYRTVQRAAASAGTDVWKAERDSLGCTHAEVGAYLLGIWGLPSSIVEAVAWHHRPVESPIADFSPLAAVHAANVFQAQLEPQDKRYDASLDQGFLERIGLAGRQEKWLEVCKEEFASRRLRSPIGR